MTRSREARDKLFNLFPAGYRVLWEALELYYRQFGCGQLGHFSAFRWDNGLQPIAHPDPIPGMDHGYDYQKRSVGQYPCLYGRRPANNILLYGAKRTGKSSSVKALLHIFAEQ